MQSVTSNAVFNAVNDYEEWVCPAYTGISIKKIGRFCYLTVMQSISSATSPFYISGTNAVPQKFCPISPMGFRAVYINNTDDTPEGQFILNPDGVIRIYKGGGGTINMPNGLVVQGVYIAV